jgi:hypothetical protein
MQGLSTLLSPPSDSDRCLKVLYRVTYVPKCCCVTHVRHQTAATNKQAPTNTTYRHCEEVPVSFRLMSRQNEYNTPIIVVHTWRIDSFFQHFYIYYIESYCSKMCQVPLVSTSGDPNAATTGKDDEFTTLKSSSKYTPNQERLIRAGEIWRSYIAPSTLVFVLVLPMIIYNKVCKFRSLI